MPLKKPIEDLAPSTQQVYDFLRKSKDIKPRVRMALRMYANGACKTLSEAAELCDVSLSYLSLKKNSPVGEAYMTRSQEILDEKASNWSQCINELGKRAVGIIADRMEDESNPNLQLKAAIDIADRAPETSKVQKMQIESFVLDARDAKSIAAALVEASGIHTQYKSLATGNHDSVTPQPPELPCQDTLPQQS